MIPPPLHVICPDAELTRPDAEARLGAVLGAGGDAVALHLRPRAAPVRVCLDLAQALVPVATESGGWVVLNGRVDIALAAGAQAVQLGRGALPIGAARKVLGPRRAIGASVHGSAECHEAFAQGADYVLLGTIFPTPSHPGAPLGGTERIARCAGAGGPLIAIGGIDASSIPGVLAAGAHGVAVIRAVWGRTDPVRAVHELRAALETGFAPAEGPEDDSGVR